MCAGSGCIGLSVFKERQNKINQLFLIEINPRQVYSIKKTVSINNLNNDKIKVINSNVFDELSIGIKFHLVSCNPPHFEGKIIQESQISGIDENWSFHKKFLKSIPNYLEQNGIVTLLENKKGSNPNTFTQFFSNSLRVSNTRYFNDSSFYMIEITKQNSLSVRKTE